MSRIHQKMLFFLSLMFLGLSLAASPASADCLLSTDVGMKDPYIYPITSVTVGQKIMIGAKLCLDSWPYNHGYGYEATLVNTMTNESITLTNMTLSSNGLFSDSTLSGVFDTSSLSVLRGTVGDPLRIRLSAWQVYCCGTIFHQNCNTLCYNFNESRTFNLTLYPRMAASPGTGGLAPIEAGPIFTQAEADTKCPAACSTYGTWDGTWRTSVSGRMSVCGCRFNAPWAAPIEAGPIYSNTEAQSKCPVNCSRYGTWGGDWRTTVPGLMSVCGCQFSISNLGWTQKALDSGRGLCVYQSKQNTCAPSSSAGQNCWICDDQQRDDLNMNTANLNFVTELKRGTTVLEDGRYIYVLRGNDNRLLIRRYDRNVEDATCTQLYQRYRFPGNYRGTSYLHVRHSQLNGGWNPLWAAGELKIMNGQVVAINNESGHFKPSVSNVGYAVNTMKAWGIPLSSDLQWGEYNIVSAKLTSEECFNLLHDGT